MKHGMKGKGKLMEIWSDNENGKRFEKERKQKCYQGLETIERKTTR